MTARAVVRWLLAVSLVAAGKPAGAEKPLPKGIAVGPWILAPLVESRWGYDGNPFYKSNNDPGTETPADEAGSEAENSTRLSAGLAAHLPIRSSNLALAYRREKLDYERTALRKDTTDDFAAEVRLRFPTSDEAMVRLGYVDGAADTARFDPGGETPFRGDAYTYWTEEVEVSRGVYASRGYSVRILHEDFSFPETDDPGFFEFDGWTARVEHRESIGQSAWAVATYYGRRYDHTCRGNDPTGSPCPPAGVPFRVEKADAVYAGVRGQLGGRSPYLLTLGYADLRYEGGGEPGYNGPVAEGEIRVPVGRHGFVEAAAFRRFYSSFYLDNNYYVQAGAAVRAAVERSDRWGAGAAIQFTNSRYPSDPPGQEVPRRRDATWRMEAYANLYLPRQFGLRLAVTDENRDSNVPGLGFDRRTLVVGAFFGWL